MKKLIVAMMLFLSVSCAYAQHTADIGVQVAAAINWGDIQSQNNAKSITPAFGILGRWNFNKRMAIRGQLVAGSLKGVGLYKDALIAQSGVRATNFAADPNFAFNFSRNFQSVEALCEFNFKNYRLGNMKKEMFTPFVALGLGGFNSGAPRTGSFILDPNVAVPANPSALPPTAALYPPYSGSPAGSLPLTNGYKVLTMTIPVGAGIKFNISKRLGGLAELIIRKTFNDNIDNLNDPGRFIIDSANPPVNYLNPTKGLNNNDWYATLAVSLTWQLWSDKGNCALYDKLKTKR
jgi:hypothetical protein